MSRNAVAEVGFVARQDAIDPWAEIELDVEFTDPAGVVRVVPAFWAGGRDWRVRYTSSIEGEHVYRTVVRAEYETGLEAQSGVIEVAGYSGDNPLRLHGAPMLAPDQRHLMHQDGTPFFWLADTWWSAFTARFRWPDTFQTLAADRRTKGFTVIQLVAGLVPEFGLFSPLMASEGGQPWNDHGNGSINPAFFDVPDVKIDHLVANGLVPCIVGGWGFWAGILGREKILQHWRYLVARYAAYPVVWCLAGEADFPIPYAPIDGESGSTEGVAQPQGGSLEDDLAELREAATPQVAVWEEASQLVAEIDPFRRVRTVHPCPSIGWSSSGVFSSRGSFDLDMLQTGHSGFAGIPDTMQQLRACVAHGDKPVINGECSYEGIGAGCWDDVQRFLFWSHMLSGAAGHSYGTMPISTFSSRDDHYLPVGRASSADWEDAIQWRGAGHVGIGRRILERLRWWEFVPSPGSMEPHASPDDWFQPYAASHPDGSIVVYLPGVAQSAPKANRTLAWLREKATLLGLDPGARYLAMYVDPRTGAEQPAVPFETDDGRRPLAGLSEAADESRDRPTWEDWVLIVRPGRTVSSTTSRPWP